MDDEQIREILKGLKLNDKDSVTDYMKNIGQYRTFDVYLRAIVKRRGETDWNPRSTWLSEYREAAAMTIESIRVAGKFERKI